MDKKDEEELKEWKEKNLNYVENYGIDIYENGKKKKKAEKIIDFTNRVVKIIMIIFALIIIIFTAGLLVYRWKIIHDSLHINPKETIEAMYDQQITEVSKNINSNQNGSYIYEIKSKPEINLMLLLNGRV